jgi:hypothetical protein
VKPAVTLTVGLNVTFDRAHTSTAVMLRVRDEARAIWNAYGVALRWPDDRSAGANLHLDVIVDRRGAADDATHPDPELGHTTLDCSGFARGPIRISMGTIEESIARAPNADPVLRVQQVAIATGRVLAHEIGHALLGTPSYHDAGGLMRPSFRVGDLTELNRGLFRLSAASVKRLLARVPALSGPVAVSSEPVAADRCT